MESSRHDHCTAASRTDSSVTSCWCQPSSIPVCFVSDRSQRIPHNRNVVSGPISQRSATVNAITIPALRHDGAKSRIFGRECPNSVTSSMRSLWYRGIIRLIYSEITARRSGPNHHTLLHLPDENKFDVIRVQEPWTVAKDGRSLTKTHPHYHTFAPEQRLGRRTTPRKTLSSMRAASKQSIPLGFRRPTGR